MKQARGGRGARGGGYDCRGRGRGGARGGCHGQGRVIVAVLV